MSKKGAIMQRINFSVAHIESIQAINNPFSKPECVYDYAFRDEIFKIKDELIKIIEFGVSGSENTLSTFRANEFIKDIPDRLFVTLKEIGNDNGQIGDCEDKLKKFYFELAKSLGYKDGLIEYCWQRADSKARFKEFASIFS